MSLNRPPQAAKNSAPAAETTSPRGQKVRTGLFGVVSVTAVATATCALWALPASAATASAHAKHPSTTSVSFSPTPAWVGQRVRLSAKVKSSGRIPTGTVTFKWAGRTLCVGHLRRGTASCVTSFGAAGSYLVKGFYSGNAAHLGSVGTTGVVAGRSPTTTAITGAGAIITVGKSYIFHVTVTSPAGTPAATGTVQLAPVPPTTLSGHTCTAVLPAGVGSCTGTPAQYGIANYTATYSGNAAHTGSASDGKFTLAAQNVTTTTVNPQPTTTTSGKLN